MLRLVRLAFLCAFVLGTASAAHADATAFFGVNTSPSNRPVVGFAAGFSLVVIGFEFEYARTKEDLEAQAPSLTTGMGNVYVQTPIVVSGLQFYGTVGGGFYRERFGETGETHFGSNLGGGVKISLAGPLRLRLDYRLFNLRGEATHAHPQRLYAGLTLAF
jgi:hypothetical protein